MSSRRIAPFLMTFILSLGCRRATLDEERLHNAEQRAKVFTTDAEDTRRRAQALTAEWEDLRYRQDEARTRMHEAVAALEIAASAYDLASVEYRKAAATADDAKQRWEFFRQLVLVAASIDAKNLDASRSTGRAPPPANCADGMSTAAFRALLAAKGVDLAGKDIDHIVPRSLGGADHPSNYQVLDASTNRSLGNTWNEAKCGAVGADRCATAVHVSRRCGSFRGLGF